MISSGVLMVASSVSTPLDYQVVTFSQSDTRISQSTVHFGTSMSHSTVNRHAMSPRHQ